jgi:hypothetical protein
MPIPNDAELLSSSIVATVLSEVQDKEKKHPGT